MRRVAFVFLLALVGAGAVAEAASPPPKRIAPWVKIEGVKVGGVNPHIAYRRVTAAYASAAALRARQGALGSYAVVARRGRRHRRRHRPGARRADGRGGLDRHSARPEAGPALRQVARPPLPARAGRRAADRARRASALDLAGEDRPRGAPRLDDARDRQPAQLDRAAAAAARVPRARADVKKAEFGPVIVIQRGANVLTLFDGESTVRTFGVATGSAQYPSRRSAPGRSWTSSATRGGGRRTSDWAKDAKPIPPGPGNPLGTRWMGLVGGGGRHPRDSRCRLDRLLGFARLHPDARAGGRVAVRAGRDRHARRHHLGR